MTTMQTRTVDAYVQPLLFSGAPKLFYTTNNIGKVRYTVSYHDGVGTHRDGSPFYGIACCSNRKHRDAFLKQLRADGYAER